MDKTDTGRQPPRGLQRLLWRAPIWLYRVGLGRLLGKRLMLLTHTGRKSGQPRQAVVEVAKFDPAANTYRVASGFGAKSDWYRNVCTTPRVTIQVGNRRMQAEAHPLSPAESGAAMVDYAHHNPSLARALAKVIGYQVDGTDEDYRQVAEQHIPFVDFRVL
ncbi:MAG: nitroreductase family deazaflavin-dependent oxidoreductase [Caldilineaceae bacterium]|nr:nitroreductase family deazaflavin-dependent oxidoreductase [Caldilineaceae bacterium]